LEGAWGDGEEELRGYVEGIWLLPGGVRGVEVGAGGGEDERDAEAAEGDARGIWNGSV